LSGERGPRSEDTEEKDTNLCGIPHRLGGFEEEEEGRIESLLCFGWFGLL